MSTERETAAAVATVMLIWGLLTACGSSVVPSANSSGDPNATASPSKVVAVDGPSYDSLSALAERADAVAVVRFLALVESTTDGQIDGAAEPSGLPVQVWSVSAEEQVAGVATPTEFRVAILDPTIVSSSQEPVAVGDRRVAFIYSSTLADETTYFVAGLGQGLVLVADDGSLAAPDSASPSLSSDIDRVGSVAALRAELGG